MKVRTIIIACFAFVVSFLILFPFFDSKRDPYEEGMHWDYRIECENGFVYKIKRQGTMQIFNSDGTPLRCGQKIY